MSTDGPPHDDRASLGEKRIADGGDRLGEIFDAMSVRRRRYVLYYLQEEEVADIDAVATHVVAQEQDISIDEIPDDVISTIRVDLFHNHLPKLQSAALVEYDQRSKVVRYRLSSGLLDELLGLAAKFELRN